MRARTERGASPRPVHLRPGAVALVAAGGALGTLARSGVTAAVGAGTAWPLATTVENLTGAAALGLLLGVLGRRTETPRVRAARLALGTGVLGGYTTYSALAVEVQRLAAGGEPLLGVAYGVVSVVAGVLAALAGVDVGGGRTGVRSPRDRDAPDAPEAAP